MERDAGSHVFYCLSAFYTLRPVQSQTFQTSEGRIKVEFEEFFEVYWILHIYIFTANKSLPSKFEARRRLVCCCYCNTEGRLVRASDLYEERGGGGGGGGVWLD